jgi:heme exporter protein D
MEQFLAMGGYAAYVWPAYGISLAVLLAAVVWTVAAERRVRRRLAQIEGSRG